MTLEDLRIRLNQHRMMLRSKNRISDERVQIYFENEDGDLVAVKSTELLYENNKAIIVLS